MPSTRVRRAAATLGLLMLLTGCAKHNNTVDLGLRKVTPDRAFKAKGSPPPSLRSPNRWRDSGPCCRRKPSAPRD